MLGKNILRKFVTAMNAVAVLTVYSMVALAVPGDVTGEITVTGQVTVNGQSAVSNTTIVSGSSVITGAGSSATVNLGKTGRVELLENTNATLNFTPNGIVVIATAGKLRVANAAGVATTVTTKDATLIADAGQANNFLVEIECSHTHVDATSGLVTVREGSSDRQIAAGSSATAGNMAQTGCEPCLRPGSAPPLRFAGLPWLILLGAGAAGAAILIGTRKTDTTIGGGTIVVSPTR
ncbi:MAG: hypothetical protein IPM21_13815 [Acidobacteria bacterium]|nr:hypothetical protein [Acidobacteriota bacterium]